MYWYVEEKMHPIDIDTELEWTANLTNVLLEAEVRIRSLKGNREYGNTQIFGLKQFSKICEILESYMTSNNSLLVKGILTRSMIEVVADLTEIYHTDDREKVIHEYLITSYESYNELTNDLLKWNQRAVKTYNDPLWKKKRMFHKSHDDWGKKRSITARVRAIDNNNDALNFYDILSHFTHIAGTGSYNILQEQMETLIYRLMNYYSVLALSMLGDFNVFTRQEESIFLKLADELYGRYDKDLDAASKAGFVLPGSQRKPTA